MDVDSGEMGRRERRRIEVQERIREAAAALFEEKGYESTTVEEIAERADVAKGTLFNHFPRKDALLMAVRDEWLAAAMDTLATGDAATGTRAEWIRRMFRAFAGIAERQPQLAKVMVIEGMRTLWVRSEAPPEEVEFRRLMREQVEAGQASGEFAHAVDAGVAAALIEGAYATTLVEWLISGSGDRTLNEELDMKFDIVFRGLAARGAQEGGTA